MRVESLKNEGYDDNFLRELQNKVKSNSPLPLSNLKETH